MKRTLAILILIGLTGLSGLALAKSKQGGKKMALELVSAAFSEGNTIPTKFTEDGENVSPPLKWTPGPDNTKGFALVCDDPDAPRGTWVHWVVYNIPPHVIEFAEGVPKEPVIQEGIRQGVNSSGKIGYDGPAPPKGPAHRYFFKIYALDSVIDLKPGMSNQDLMKAIQGRVIEEAVLMGKYKR